MELAFITPPAARRVSGTTATAMSASHRLIEKSMMRIPTAVMICVMI